MKRRMLLFIILICVNLAAGRTVRHKISKGESLSLISLNYTGTVNNTNRIARYNGIRKADRIKIGKSIIIPGGLYAPVTAFKTPEGLSEKEYFETGEDAVKEKNFFKAAGYFDAAYKKGHAPPALYNHALALYYSERFDEAVRLLEKSPEKTDDHWVLLSLCYFSLEKLSDFERAVGNIGPETAGTDTYLLSVLYELAGDKVKAAGLKSMSKEGL